jgi:hypothetical protein
MKASIVFTE